MRRILILAAWVLLVQTATAQDVPVLSQQTPAGEANPLCCAVAVAGFVPLTYVGVAIPIVMGGGNYIGVNASQVPDFEVVRIKLSGPNYREVYGTAYPMPGWPGRVWILFFAPDDVDGEYQIRIRYAGHDSAPVLIRFAGPVPASIERGDLERPLTRREP